MSGKYYAVHIGRCGPKVFGPGCCWYHDVLPHVVGYKNARFKSFRNLNDALAFASRGCSHPCPVTCIYGIATEGCEDDTN